MGTDGFFPAALWGCFSSTATEEAQGDPQHWEKRDFQSIPGSTAPRAIPRNTASSWHCWHWGWHCPTPLFPLGFSTSPPCSSSLSCPLPAAPAQTHPRTQETEIYPKAWLGWTFTTRTTPQSQTGILPALCLHTKSPKILTGVAGAASVSPALLLQLLPGVTKASKAWPSSLMLLNYVPPFNP